jgi:ribosomal protein L15
VSGDEAPGDGSRGVSGRRRGRGEVAGTGRAGGGRSVRACVRVQTPETRDFSSVAGFALANRHAKPGRTGLGWAGLGCVPGQDLAW